MIFVEFPMKFFKSLSAKAFFISSSKFDIIWFILDIISESISSSFGSVPFWEGLGSVPLLDGLTSLDEGLTLLWDWFDNI